MILGLLSSNYPLALLFYLKRKVGSRNWLRGAESTDYCQSGPSALGWLGVDSALCFKLLVHAGGTDFQAPCSGPVTEGSLAQVVCVRGPSCHLSSAVGTELKKPRAGKLAGSIKGEHFCLCWGWIFRFLIELLAATRTLYFISTVKYLA